MGYVHSFGLKKPIKEIPAEALNKVKEIVEIYKDILRYEHYEKDKLPEITETTIRFNGYGDNGYETFVFCTDSSSYEFVKTNRVPYDKAVTKILLVLFNYIPEFILSSDGFYLYPDTAKNFEKTKKLDECEDHWTEALEFVKDRYGIEFEWVLNESRERTDTYYSVEICRKP